MLSWTKQREQLSIPECKLAIYELLKNVKSLFSKCYTSY